MLTRTCVPHYPPATYYPTILPHSRRTRGEGSHPKERFFAKAKRYKKRKEKKESRRKKICRKRDAETNVIYIRC